MRACIIFNPAAKGDKARTFRAHLDRLAQECDLRPTTGPGAGQALAAEAVRSQYDTIIAAGGDGTINEVLNGLVEAGGCAQARLGVIPLGTVNVFARELGVPRSVEHAWRIIAAGRERLVDLPVLTRVPPGGANAQRHFVQMAGAGLDARAVELLDWRWKKRVGALAYVMAGCRAMQQVQPIINVRGDGRSYQGELVLVGNGRRYGGDFILFPQAAMDDGLLDVTVFPRVNWWRLVICGRAFLTKQFAGAAGAFHFQAREIELTSTSPVPVETEGELVGHLPARVTVRPRVLRVLVP
jgi:YegS/Rv2252/BmrU family lipid kinase